MRAVVDCSIPGCDRPVRARTWCITHYTRWKRNGDPLAGGAVRLVYESPEKAFQSRTVRDPATGCLLWTGVLTSPGGYGQLRVGGRMVGAHRYAWERGNGPVPEGMTVDHEDCYRHDCVELSHLRLASNAQNVRNRSGAMPGSATGIRNVHRHNNGYRVTVTKLGERHRSIDFATVEEAARAASEMRAELFGEFAGRG